MIRLHKLLLAVALTLSLSAAQAEAPSAALRPENLPALAGEPTPSPLPEPAFTSSPSPGPTVSPEPTLAPIIATEVTESQIADDGKIRVLLSSLGKPSGLSLTLAGAYSVENDAGFCFERGTELTAFVHDGEVWLSVGGLSIRMGSSVTLTRHRAEGENGLYIAQSEKHALYNGDLTLDVSEGALRAVLTTDVEEYLYGVVAYEMSDSFPLEALKAQAVAARTYAMQRKYAAGTRCYDVVDTTADQVFKGFDARYQNVIAAVDATRGVVGTYRGAFAACYYTASNGGQIARPNDVWGGSGDDGYIEMREDPFDLENPYSLVNSIEFAADLSDCAALKRMVVEQLDGESELVRVEAITPAEPAVEGSRMATKLLLDVIVRAPVSTPSPAPTTTPRPLLGLFLREEAPRTEWREETVRVTLSVYDQIKDGLNLGLNGRDYELIEVEKTETGYRLEMRRFGHGSGMSQRGAQQMAGAHGYRWQEILNFYYPGMQLEKIDWPETELTELSALPDVKGYARPDPTPTPTPAPLPEPEAGERRARVKLENADSALNVRETPSTGGRVLDRFGDGREVLVCGEADENGWIRIRTAELTGYVMEAYLTYDEQP